MWRAAVGHCPLLFVLEWEPGYRAISGYTCALDSRFCSTIPKPLAAFSVPSLSFSNLLRAPGQVAAARQTLGTNDDVSLRCRTQALNSTRDSTAPRYVAMRLDLRWRRPETFGWTRKLLASPSDRSRRFGLCRQRSDAASEDLSAQRLVFLNSLHDGCQ